MLVICRYNMPDATENHGFSVTARQLVGQARLEICAAYTGSRPATGMVLLELELVTGWQAVNPDRSILYYTIVSGPLTSSG